MSSAEPNAAAEPTASAKPMLPKGWEAPAECDAFASSLTEHGILVLRQFLPKTAVDVLRAEMQAVLRRAVDGEFESAHVMYDDIARVGTLKQIQQLADKSGRVRRLVDDELTPVATAALGEPAVLRNVQYFNKPPTSAYAEGGSSRATPPHQDAYYFLIEPPHNAVTM